MPCTMGQQSHASCFHRSVGFLWVLIWRVSSGLEAISDFCIFVQKLSAESFNREFHTDLSTTSEINRILYQVGVELGIHRVSASRQLPPLMQYALQPLPACGSCEQCLTTFPERNIWECAVQGYMTRPHTLTVSSRRISDTDSLPEPGSLRISLML